MSMKEKKKLFNIATYGQMLIDVILFALGVYSASNPTSSNTVIGVAFGISLSVVGIYNIIKYIFRCIFAMLCHNIYYCRADYNTVGIC